MPPKRRAAAPPATASTSAPKPARQSKLAKENNISASIETEIKEAFNLCSSGAGSSATIPTSSIHRALAALGCPASSSRELAELTDAADPDESGECTYANFVAIAALKLQSRSEDEEREEVERAFNLFTGGAAGAQEDGRITLGMLKRVARSLKEDVDEQLLKDMILEANGGTGVTKGVNLEEFEGVMRRAGVLR